VEVRKRRKKKKEETNAESVPMCPATGNLHLLISPERERKGGGKKKKEGGRGIA